MQHKILRLVPLGGLSDALLLTPSLKALKQKHKDHIINVYCLHRIYYEVLKNNPYIDILHPPRSVLMPLVISILNFFRLKKYIFTNYDVLKPSLFYKHSAIDIIGERLHIEIQDKKLQIFLTEQEETQAKAFLNKYTNPVILHIKGACTPNKNWNTCNWEQVIQSTPGFSFIQLGLPSEDEVKGSIDMRGKLSIREAFGLIKYAYYFIGVDSVFAHAASAFGIPAIVLFGPSAPIIWGHPGNINIYKKVPCSPCMDILGASTCPYNRECMNQITVKDVRKAFLQLIVNKK